MTSKQFIVVILAFLFGLGIMHIYTKQEINSVKKVTVRIIDNCMQTFVVNNEIVANYKAINSEFVACLTNQEICNYKETANKLLTLTKERRVLESKLNNISDQTQQIFDDTKRNN